MTKYEAMDTLVRALIDKGFMVTTGDHLTYDCCHDSSQLRVMLFQHDDQDRLVSSWVLRLQEAEDYFTKEPAAAAARAEAESK